MVAGFQTTFQHFQWRRSSLTEKFGAQGCVSPGVSGLVMELQLSKEVVTNVKVLSGIDSEV